MSAHAIQYSQRYLMEHGLAGFLPFLDEAAHAGVFGSIYLTAKYPLGDPIRMGVIQGERELLSRLVVIILLLSDLRTQPIARQ